MSTKIALKLNQIKQWKNKLSDNIINDLSDQIYSILGGTCCILDHYVDNARYLKLTQVDELHQLLESAKKTYSKNKLQNKLQNKSQNKRKRKRANSHQTKLNITQSSTSFIDIVDQQLLTPKKTEIKHSKSMEYQPIFGSRSAEIAEQRQNKREKKRRGSGLEQRMKMEKSNINNDNIVLFPSRDDISQQSDMSDLSDYDDNDNDDNNVVYHNDNNEMMITPKTYYDNDDGYGLRQDKKRKYSISEHTDWESDNDELEVKQSNEYFNKLEKKYKKKKKKKKAKKDKKKLKKMMKLERMTMEQMRKDKTNKRKDISSIQSMSNETQETHKIHETQQDTKQINSISSTNKPTMDSPEFIAYFEKFMSENSSFYTLQIEDDANDDINEYYYSESEREYDS